MKAKRPERLRLGGILFLIAGVTFLLAGALGERTVFFVLGCAFLAIGAGAAARARK